MTTVTIEGPAVLEINMPAPSLNEFISKATRIAVNYFGVGEEKIVLEEINAEAVVSLIGAALYYNCSCQATFLS